MSLFKCIFYNLKCNRLLRLSEICYIEADLIMLEKNMSDEPLVSEAKQKFELALSYCNEALRLKPFLSRGRLLKASIMICLKEYHETICICKELLQDEPDNIEAHYTLANAYYLMNKTAEAKKILRKIAGGEIKNKNNYHILQQNAIEVLETIS